MVFRAARPAAPVQEGATSQELGHRAGTMFRALILVVGLATAAIACGDEEPELTLPATTPSTTTTESTEERADEPTTTDTDASLKPIEVGALADQLSCGTA